MHVRNESIYDILIIDRNYSQNKELYASIDAQDRNLVVSEKTSDALRLLQNQFFHIAIMHVEGMSENEIAGLAALIREYSIDPTFYLIAITTHKSDRLSLGRLTSQGVDDVVETRHLPERLWDRITVGLRVTGAHHHKKVKYDAYTVCGYTHKIQNESGEWESLLKFLNKKFKMKFKFGKCPEYSGKL